MLSSLGPYPAASFKYLCASTLRNRDPEYKETRSGAAVSLNSFDEPCVPAVSDESVAARRQSSVNEELNV